MTVKGHLDGFQGSYVVGWADGESGTCRITVTTDDGTLLASGLASVHRPDLQSLGLGRTNISFRIPVGGVTGRQAIHVLADGIELPNSPTHIGPGYYDGDCTVHRGAVHGWVSERCPSAPPSLVEIIDQDGNVVGSAMADRNDASTDPLFLQDRFRIELAAGCFGRGELWLRARANGAVFARTSCTLLLEGNVEHISEKEVSGWLLSPSAPDRALTVQAFRGGVLVGSGPCRLLRDDVRHRFPECSHAGFRIDLDRRALNGFALNDLSLRLAGSSTELFDGPYVVGSPTACVIAARKVARLALDPRLNLADGERAVLQSAMLGVIAGNRAGQAFNAARQVTVPAAAAEPRLTVVIPIYRGVEVTRACIKSVLSHRDASLDRILLINDCSPEHAMAPMLANFAGRRNLFILDNPSNLGFIKSVNRGLSFCSAGDVVLLNSDTRMFAGGLDELWRVAHGDPAIGTVTAMSNNATIFSYPHMDLRRPGLDDIGWGELAGVAREINRGMAIDVPTGHGFCMLITRAALSHVGKLDESFGRGYGEENDFCARAADLGFRNVTAPGVLVEHTESISFGGDKASLLAVNLPILERRYPEYTPIIMEVERRDDLRSGRWGLDRARLRRAVKAGGRFALVVQHWLGGGTSKAIDNIESLVGYDGAAKLTLRCRPDDMLELSADTPLMRALFDPTETAELFRLLSAAQPRLVVIHQVLGYSAALISGLAEFVRSRHGVLYAHDFYSFCPRVTMIDAVGGMCGGAETDICARCVRIGGSHEASKLTALEPAAHRSLFADFLSAFRHVVAPSEDAAGYLRRMFPGQVVHALPHPEPDADLAGTPREGTDAEVVLLGAIGPHKGSGLFYEVAARAAFTHPALQFRVIGFTDIDDRLLALGNVTITGRYTAAELAEHSLAARGRIALFLSLWPETYSYTLSEAVRLGFVPLVPDIGAPAERVRAAGFGMVFPFPSTAEAVLRAIQNALTSTVTGSPRSFAPQRDSIAATRQMLSPVSPSLPTVH